MAHILHALKCPFAVAIANDRYAELQVMDHSRLQCHSDTWACLIIDADIIRHLIPKLHPGMEN
jgi:hypothetical protein